MPTQYSSFISPSVLIWVAPLKKTINHICSKFLSWQKFVAIVSSSSFFFFAFDLALIFLCRERDLLSFSETLISAFITNISCSFQFFRTFKVNCCRFSKANICMQFGLNIQANTYEKKMEIPRKMEMLCKSFTHL